jgi:hypothetical protein
MRSKPSKSAFRQCVQEWRIGGGYYVLVTFADGTSERIEMDTFATEAEGSRWIRNDSIASWLHHRRSKLALGD